jgi:hypothetical protein
MSERLLSVGRLGGRGTDGWRAISYGIPGHLRPRLRRWAQKSSFSFYRRHISDERYHVVSRAKVAVTDSAAVVGALLTPIAANRPDALSAKELVVAGEPGHYKELLGILPVENVTVETGEAVLDILTRLNEIERLIQGMIAFLNQAGTSETMADLMDRTESRLATNLRLLDEFHSARDEAAIESREWLGAIQGMVAELDRVVGQVRIISKQTNMLAFNAAIEATGLVNSARASPWWLPKSKKETTCTRNRLRSCVQPALRSS